MAKQSRGPLVEDGIVVGNTTQKYESGNPLTRILVNNFCEAVGELAAQAAPQTIFEVGCGEGHVTKVLLERTKANIDAVDISETILDMARENVNSSRVSFECENIYAIEGEKRRADLVVCCEVLEHLDDPQRGLEILADAAAPHAILSVPREPLWRVLNMARGAYWNDWGNTPGHLQHWSKSGFVNFVSQEFEVMQVRSVLPWTILIARSRRAV
ncbi:MAG: methyltransferase type 11 [gamma proteobacterium symbiont of Ctena orbiculata]|nr:MAG: methyltransferase type 11 [gamma proteobacterium symbiont of Ctena orbiculata]PVV18146.1 MAG: methyltransferase type 11 [gamma proteobacterium symbiont of Ctena orbiculata]PVV26883.1 MAG: methyltransferase type 11 [gamma proteobacterium symbiont of Ctena orbiculata]